MDVRVLTLRHWALISAFVLSAAGDAYLEIEPADPEALAKEASELGKSLKGSSASLPLGAAPWRKDQALRQPALAKALASQAAIKIPAGKAGLKLQGVPSIVLLQNSSTIAPWSKGLGRWAWPFQVAAYDAVESQPSTWLDAARFDVVVFSSPGWWADFANPPGGPSRMPETVALAARNFVEAGGTAIFVGIAQWDLEQAWPRSLRLASLGPYKTSKLRAAPDAKEGGLAMDPVGVAAERLLKGAFQLIFHPAFEFPDGDVRPLHAAYAFSAGAGWVLGLGFHPFEQDESLAVRAQRLVLNALLLSGARRTQGEGETPWKGTARAATPVPTLSLPPPTKIAPLVPTLIPSPLPTQRLPTAIVIQWPTATRTPRPRPSATASPTARPTPSPRPSPTQRATALPIPTPRPRTSATRTVTLLRTPTRKATPARPATLTATAFIPLPPTPRPTPSPLSRPSVAPTPAPRPSLAPLPQERMGPGLGCLSSSPEPFGDGGVYVFFCLRSGAGIKLSVFDQKGRLRYAGQESWSGPGQGQVFFAGRDERGKALQPGDYLYQVEARYGPGGRLGAESKQGSFTFSRSRPKR